MSTTKLKTPAQQQAHNLQFHSEQDAPICQECAEEFAELLQQRKAAIDQQILDHDKQKSV